MFTVLVWTEESIWGALLTAWTRCHPIAIAVTYCSVWFICVIGGTEAPRRGVDGQREDWRCSSNVVPVNGLSPELERRTLERGGTGVSGVLSFPNPLETPGGRLLLFPRASVRRQDRTQYACLTGSNPFSSLLYWKHTEMFRSHVRAALKGNGLFSASCPDSLNS